MRGGTQEPPSSRLKGRENQEKHLPELVSQEDTDLVASRGDNAFRAPSPTDTGPRGLADPLTEMAY